MKSCYLITALTTLAFGSTASAQLAPSSDEPVDITGSMAEFEDNLATWTGNVRIVQGESILTADRIEAELNDDGDFDRIHAFGTVRYSNGKEAITGEKGVYDAVNRTITITKNVILTQGKQVMSAGAVTYWVDSGKVRFEPESGERIRGVFYTERVDDSI